MGPIPLALTIGRWCHVRSVRGRKLLPPAAQLLQFLGQRLTQLNVDAEEPEVLLNCQELRLRALQLLPEHRQGVQAVERLLTQVPDLGERFVSPLQRQAAHQDRQPAADLAPVNNAGGNFS